MTNLSIAFKRFLISALAAAALACSASAKVEISASVDKQTVSLNDTIMLSVTITADSNDLPEPQLPSLPNFNVYSSGQSQTFSIVNGRISGSVVYAYSLTPRFVGKATIEPIEVRQSGQIIKTPPITVTVVPPSQQSGQAPVQQYAKPSQGRAGRQASRQAQSGQDVFVTAEVDNPRPYVNQQTTLTVTFYCGIPLLGNPQYKPPSNKSFITEDMPPVRTGEKTVNGRTYYYSEIKTALFGIAPGKVTVDPAMVQYLPRSNEDIDPFAADFLQKFFAQGNSSAGATKEARSKPIEVDIRPLPGASVPTGNFKVSASLDRKSMKSGEAVNLNISIKGVGNLRAVTAPVLPDMSDTFRVMDTVSSVNIRKDGDIVQGEKNFKTVLIARASGKQTIPPIKFTFFDPSTGKYHDTQTEPIEIDVEQGDSAAATQISFNGAQGASVTSLTEDIRYIMDTTKSRWLSHQICAIARSGAWNLLPLILFAMATVVALVKESRASDPDALKFKKAFSRAKASIKDAETLLAQGQKAEAAGILQDALEDYLSAKLAAPVRGTRFKDIQSMMKTRYPDFSETSQKNLDIVWQELEMLRFASLDGGNPAVAARLLETISSMEKELKK